jgi:hypothetical protein
MSKRNTHAGKALRRELRDRRERGVAAFPATEQRSMRAVMATPEYRELAEAMDQLAESVPQPVIQQAMTAMALAEGGPDACQICGDTPAHQVRWASGAGGGRLCDDCIGIQQSMYGDPTQDRLVRIMSKLGHPFRSAPPEWNWGDHCTWFDTEPPVVRHPVMCDRPEREHQPGTFSLADTISEAGWAKLYDELWPEQ